MKWIFIVFCFFLGSLFFRQQELPGEWVSSLCARFSSPDLVVGCSSASVGFRHGFHFQGVRVYDRTRRENMVPVFSAESVSIWLVSRRVKVVSAKLPRLGDSYYYGEAAGAPKAEKVDLATLRFPKLPRFALELERPEILGVAPARVEAEVRVRPRGIWVSRIKLDWPGQEARMWLDGDCAVDLDRRRIIGGVRGSAVQAHIRPLLKALDLPVSYPYMGGYPETGKAGFTEVIGPVPVSCDWNADLVTGEFSLDIDVHPEMGRYNGVRMRRADGGIGVHVYFPGDWMGYDIRIGPLVASDLKGRTLEGVLTVHGTNNLDYLEFDAQSTLDKQNLLDIMDCLNDGTLDFIECLTPPTVTANGVFNIDEVNIPNNDFGGRMSVASARFLSNEVSAVSCDYRFRGDGIAFSNLAARAKLGGRIGAGVELRFPGFTGSNTTFHAAIDYRDGSLAEMADSLKFDLGEKHGKVDAHFDLSGPLDSESRDQGLAGSGNIRVSDGRLARIPVFSVLTSALADNVPGFDKLVDQSEACCDFTVGDGKFRTDNLVVEGAVFCIKASGSYDFVNDDLDFIVHCTFLKKESLLGKYLIQPILWPFTKLLTEFRLRGQIDDPKIYSNTVNTLKKAID